MRITREEKHIERLQVGSMFPTTVLQHVLTVARPPSTMLPNLRQLQQPHCNVIATLAVLARRTPGRHFLHQQ